MGIFDDLLKDGGSAPPWGRIAATFMGGLQTATGGGRQVVEQLTRWGALLAQNGVQSWAESAEKQRFCSHEKCDAQGFVKCAACKRLSCMAHSMVNHHAEGLCEDCAIRLLRISMHGGVAEEARKRAAERLQKERAAAFRTLGLKQTASWLEIRTKYRSLVLKHHPDRAKTSASQAKAESRLRRINNAFAVLRSLFEKQEAA